jgi:hypothetical protein
VTSLSRKLLVAPRALFVVPKFALDPESVRFQLVTKRALVLPLPKLALVLRNARRFVVLKVAPRLVSVARRSPRILLARSLPKLQ